MSDTPPDQPGPTNPTQNDIQQALQAIGAWSDLDWDELVQGLHEIRHRNAPTPPIEDL